MRAGLLLFAATVLVFTPTASAEEASDTTACVTVWDPSGGVYLPHVDVAYCVGTVIVVVEKVTGKPDAA